MISLVGSVKSRTSIVHVDLLYGGQRKGWPPGWVQTISITVTVSIGAHVLVIPVLCVLI